MDNVHWRDRAIGASEGISDAFEVLKTYGARLADWILFFCLIGDILEIFPLPEPFATTFGNIVLGAQVITLDIAGFGLTSMGDHAERRGDSKSARKARVMGWTLISIMIGTVALVTTAILIPQTKDVVDDINKALMLVRVGVTVIYGHVIHQLRSAGNAHVDRLKGLEREVTNLQNQLNAKQQGLHEKVASEQEQAKMITDLRTRITNLSSEQSNLISRMQQEHQQALAAQEQKHREECNRLSIAHSSQIHALQEKLNTQAAPPARGKIKEMSKSKTEEKMGEGTVEETVVSGLYSYGKAFYENPMGDGKDYATKAEAAKLWGISTRQVEGLFEKYPEYVITCKEEGDEKPRARLICTDARTKIKKAS
jgi:hypothetical protein